MVAYCVELDVVERLGQPDLGLVTNKGAIGTWASHSTAAAVHRGYFLLLDRVQGGSLIICKT